MSLLKSAKIFNSFKKASKSGIITNNLKLFYVVVIYQTLIGYREAMLLKSINYSKLLICLFL
ncbi:hypothetical protein SMNC_0590 [Candidatus Karelsulcia muelleri]|nr:hypothetical protein SMNC_0590 [Candidatus Karelsulcia muelleri]